MDLQKLSRTTESGQSPRVPRPRRKWLTRIALPAAIALATLMLLLYAARNLILPATPVQTTTATALSVSGGDAGDAATHTEAAARPSAVVAQAPGWVEPDPYPIFVTALADGVVEKMHALEGQAVHAGQVVVELVDSDAKLALARARAELARQTAAESAAQIDYDEPVALRRAAAVSEAQLAASKAELLRLDAEIDKEVARQEELDAAYDRLMNLSEQSVSALMVEEAKYRSKSQRAVVEATRQRRPELEALVQTAQAEYDAARRDLELKTALRRSRDEAAAAVDDAKARVDEAELRLSRMTIKSPADGVVMARLVAPGDKLMLGADGMHTAHAIHLYDPASLQVRVDVPLSDAAQVGLGQQASIIVDVLPDVAFKGEVTRLVHQADIGKNTVQFKVAIKDPSPQLKPDMLARVQFFSGAGAPANPAVNNPASVGSSVPVAIKSSSVVRDESGTWVWWVSPVDQRIERRGIVLGGPRGEGSIEVIGGLNPGDVLVDQPGNNLKQHQRVKVENRHGPH